MSEAEYEFTMQRVREDDEAEAKRRNDELAKAWDDGWMAAARYVTDREKGYTGTRNPHRTEAAVDCQRGRLMTDPDRDGEG